MQKVKIIADSTCDLGSELIQRYDIDIAPLYVTLGQKSYRDAVEITSQEVLSYCERTKETPKTAATSVGDFIDVFRPYAEAGQDIVFLSISESMSATVQNARIAAEEFPNCAIYCVNSQSLSTGTGLLVIEAAERAEAGMDAKEIVREIEELRDKVSVSFVLNTLTYLHRGGRCSGLTAFGAAMLGIKPKISVQDGKMAPTDKFRGNIQRVMLRYLEKQLENIERIRPERVFITYSTWEEAGLAEAVQRVRATGYFREIHITRAGSVVTSHCGPQTLGIMFLEK